MVMGRIQPNTRPLNQHSLKAQLELGSNMKEKARLDSVQLILSARPELRSIQNRPVAREL